MAEKRIKLPSTCGNGDDLSFKVESFKIADTLRGKMEPSDYNHVALGLISVKHTSHSIDSKRAEFLAESPENLEESAAENVFWVPNPKEARWSHARNTAKSPSRRDRLSKGYFRMLISGDIRLRDAKRPAEVLL